MRLIDADALVEWLKRAGNFLKIETDHKRITHIIGKIIDHIEAMPTIDPESLRPKGEWIDGSVSFGAKPETYKVCSNCNTCIPKMTEVPFGMWHFCLRCGADMRKEAHNDCKG